MMRTIAILFAAAFAAVAIAPSASAMAWVPPSQPEIPDCPVTDPPAPGEEGLIAEAKSIAHTGTSAACSIEGDGEDVFWIGYGVAMREVNLVMEQLVELVGPTVDGTQDNVCDAVYGNDRPPNSPGCSEIILGADVWLGTW